MAKSLNKVMLIGNLTRDPEMRYTPQGTAVCTFGVATNRSWTTDTGDKKDDVDFHNIVAWNKLAEICAQLLKKGRKVYVEGRLSTSTWQAPDGAQRNKTEIIINDMIILDRKMDEVGGSSSDVDIPEPMVEEKAKPAKEDKKVKVVEEVGEEDIPF
ncbi:MAG TPA: single-stranded DNA-binding protein [Patescibacteria group bacterium]|nr:single-stranded DNA-binding protein [Patescibacteria group bacterium]